MTALVVTATPVVSLVVARLRMLTALIITGFGVLAWQAALIVAGLRMLSLQAAFVIIELWLGDHRLTQPPIALPAPL